MRNTYFNMVRGGSHGPSAHLDATNDHLIQSQPTSDAAMPNNVQGEKSAVKWESGQSDSTKLMGTSGSVVR